MRTGEPALILGVVSSTLSLIVALNIGLTAAQAGLWVALITALFSAVTALAVRPISPAVFTGVVVAVGDLLMGYHFHVSPGVLAGVSALLLSVMTLLTRHQVSPVTKADVVQAA
jgi:hypothetical protein